MKTSIVLFSTLLAGVQSFAPVTTARNSPALFAAIAEAERSENQLKIKEIQSKWNEVRLLDRETAKNTLDGEWLEAYNRYYELYDSDMERMIEIVTNLNDTTPPVSKKTKGQRKRDAYARKLEQASQPTDLNF